MFINKTYKMFIEAIDYHFKHVNLLNIALTHPSYFNGKVQNDSTKYIIDEHERLEFLGDSVLKLIISNKLYTEQKDFTAGKLTHSRSSLESNTNLSNICINKLYDICSTGPNPSPKWYSNILEALFGALWIDTDNDYKELVRIYNLLFDDQITENIDYKSRSLETLIGNKLEYSYRTYKKGGSDHNPIFECICSWEDKNSNKFNVTKTGGSIKNAEKEAFKILYNNLNKIY